MALNLMNFSEPKTYGLDRNTMDKETNVNVEKVDQRNSENEIEERSVSFENSALEECRKIMERLSPYFRSKFERRKRIER